MTDINMTESSVKTMNPTEIDVKPLPSRGVRRLSPYSMFQKDSEMRESVKLSLTKELGSNPTFGQLSKAVAEKWKSLSDAEREKYTKLLNKNTSDCNNVPDQVPVVEKVKKRARSAYTFFIMDPNTKENIKKETPDADFSNMSCLMAEKWKQLTTEERAPYVEQNKQEKALLSGNDNKSTSESKPTRVRQRARSGYTMYSSDKAIRQKVKDDNPGADFGTLSKLISAQWKSLDNEERAPYMALSIKEREELAITKESNNTNVRSRARSAYTLFTKDKEVLEAIRTQNPEIKFKDFSKVLSDKWSSLNDEEKEKYVKAHNEEKATIVADKEKTQVKTKQQRAKSAYTLYSSDINVRKVIKDSNPDAVFGQISKLISTQWHSLTDSERLPYVTESNKQKSEMAILKEANKKPKTRAKSAYLHYSMNVEIRTKAKDANPDMSVTELAKVLGKQWKSLNKTEQEPYHNAYLAEKEALNKSNLAENETN